MAVAGHTIENPVNGERCRWLLTAEQTGGRLTRAEVTVRPGGGVALEHVHPSSEERLELLEGELALELAGRRSTLRAGDCATIPAGVPHRWANDGSAPLRFIVEMDPPMGFEDMIETIYALARAGRIGADGKLQALDLGLVAHRFGASTRPTSPPAWVQRLTIPPLAAVARLVGHHLAPAADHAAAPAAG